MSYNFTIYTTFNSSVFLRVRRTTRVWAKFESSVNFDLQLSESCGFRHFHKKKKKQPGSIFVLSDKNHVLSRTRVENVPRVANSRRNTVFDRLTF